MCFLPESQSYYVNNDNYDDAAEVLKRGLPDDDAALELARLKYEKQFFISNKVSMGKKYRDLCKIYTKPLFICLTLAFFS
jgi:hypothetical protein